MEKKLLFILATHGDESFSIRVLKRLEKEMPKDKYKYDWIIGNEKALNKGLRFVDADLNRSAPGKDNGLVYEERRAAELIKLANKYNFVIDIHGTVSNTGIFTIIPKSNLQNILFSAMLPIKRNVIWCSNRSVEKGPVVQFCKPPALEIECGPKDDSKTSIKLEAILKETLKIMQKTDCKDLIKKSDRKDFFSVCGKQKDWNKNLKDFQAVTINREKFVPILVNQYKEIACYKMKKINFKNIFIY